MLLISPFDLFFDPYSLFEIEIFNMHSMYVRMFDISVYVHSAKVHDLNSLCE